jgi:hypothetical protein
MLKSEHQPGVLARGFTLVALLGIALVVVLLSATNLVRNLQTIEPGTPSVQAPAAYEAP